MLKKLFTHSFLYALGPQIPKVVGIFVLPIITKYLTPFDYGIFGIISSYTGLIGGLQELGLSILLVNAFYKYRKNDRWKIIWKQIYGYLISWSICYSLLLGLFLYIIIPEEAATNRWNIIMLLCSQVILFNITVMIGGRLFQMLEKPGYISLIIAITGSLTVFLNLYTIAYLKMGYMGWYISRFIATFVSFLLYVFPILWTYQLIPIFKFRPRFLVRNLKIALPTIPHNYSTYLLNSSDRMVMDNLNVKLEDLGVYNLGYTLGSYIDVIGGAIGMAVGPLHIKLLAKNTSKSKQDIKTLIFFLQVSFILGTFLVALWSKEIFQILISNPNLEGAYVFAVVIIMGYAYRPMYWAAVNQLFYKEKTSQLWKISFIAGVSNVVMNLIFIPIYGIIAAPFTTFISLMYLGFSCFFLKAYKEMNTIQFYHWVWFFVIICATILVFMLKDIFISYKIILSIFLLSVSGFFLKKYWFLIKNVKI